MISKNAKISPSAEVHPLAYIEDNVEIGDNTHVGPFCIVRKGSIIGANCKFTAYCEIRENVIVEDECQFGSRCTISANAKVGRGAIIKYAFVLTDTPDLEENNKKRVGNIGRGALIGANVTLMPGCSIGDFAIIGACSQVRDNVGESEIWFGNPARFYKKNE